jgi:hypothetical protein
MCTNVEACSDGQASFVLGGVMINAATKVHTDLNGYECTIVCRHNYYELVFPPDVTLKSVMFNTAVEVHVWLDKQFGKGSWTLK